MASSPAPSVSSSAASPQVPDGEQLGHTPVSVKRSSIAPLQQPIIASADELLKQKRKHLDDEMIWAKLPLSAWMLQCVAGQDAPDTVQFTPLSVNVATERTMYPGLEEGINGIFDTIGCKDFIAISTDSKADTSAPGSPESQDHNPLKPDMVIVPKTEAAKDVYESKPKGKKKSSSADDEDVFGPVVMPPAGPDLTAPPPGTSSRQVAAVANPPANTKQSQASSKGGPDDRTRTEKAAETRTFRMAWAFAEVVIEVKSSPSSFPFLWDKNNEVLSSAISRVQSRGQLAEYSLEMFRRQHRLFLFAIAFGGPTAVFVRFDRAGALVSEAFDYIENPAPLGNFFYRLFRIHQNGMSIPRELRGHDPTAEPACESCTALFRGLHEARKEDLDSVVLAGLKKAATKGWTVYCLLIKSPWSPDDRAVRPDDLVETHRVLVGRPLFSSLSMMGRGTRGFVGWDLDADRPVFVKDSWRAGSTRLHSELELYHKLWDGEESLSVADTHIPTVLGGGDVCVVSTGGPSVQQRTRTQDLLDYENPTSRVHSRLVIKEIGRRLKDFEHPFELANGVFGALLAHQRAWEKRKILHRDISINNILLLGAKKTSVGLLCDWDLAKTEQQLADSTPTQSMRSGTWQFMSALLQRYASKRHELSDDLESFVHIFDWSTVRYFLPNYSKLNTSAILSLLQEHFDKTTTEGHRKYERLLLGQDIATALSAGLDHPFNVMRKYLIEQVQKHYKSLGLTPDEGFTVKRKRVDVVTRNAQPDTDEFPPVLTQLGNAQTIGVPGPNDHPTVAVIDLSDPDPSTQSTTIPQTPETSPLHTHTKFVAAMSNYLNGYNWDHMEKYSQPLGGTSGSGASSSRRSSDNHDINTRPLKQAKIPHTLWVNDFRLESKDDSKQEGDTMDVENPEPGPAKKSHTGKFKAAQGIRSHPTTGPGSSKGTRRPGEK